MKLSILILTHNRPELFQRCLQSALSNIPDNVEILVNNDSFDIEEIKHTRVSYFYGKAGNLSEIYEFLADKAKGEYIYYLEDDDYLNSNFYDTVMPYLNNDYDIIGANYYPTWNDKWILPCTTSMNLEFKLDDDVFQLGQFIMKANLVKSWQFPDDSHIHNDRKLVEYILTLTDKVMNIPKIIYYQTTDGGDNISFPESSVNRA